MKVEDPMDRFIYNPVYVAIVVLVVLPINFKIVITGHVVMGLGLAAMQIPWAVAGFAGKFEWTIERLKNWI